jgi:hypothetical protein
MLTTGSARTTLHLSGPAAKGLEQFVEDRGLSRVNQQPSGDLRGVEHIDEGLREILLWKTAARRAGRQAWAFPNMQG